MHALTKATLHHAQVDAVHKTGMLCHATRAKEPGPAGANKSAQVARATLEKALTGKCVTVDLGVAADGELHISDMLQGRACQESYGAETKSKDPLLRIPDSVRPECFGPFPDESDLILKMRAAARLWVEANRAAAFLCRREGRYGAFLRFVDSRGGGGELVVFVLGYALVKAIARERQTPYPAGVRETKNPHAMSRQEAMRLVSDALRGNSGTDAERRAVEKVAQDAVDRYCAALD